MEISIVVPTYQGKHKLPVILKALERQTFKDFELIIVIDGSTDGTKDWLEMQKTNLLNFKWVQQSNRGRAAARNAGAKIASGKLLIFYDDDMEPESNSVAGHVNAHISWTNSVIVGNVLEYMQANNSDIMNYKARLCHRWLMKYHPGINTIYKENLFLTAANFSIQKGIFLGIGGFDERLTDAEDEDLAHRFLEQGVLIYFDTLNKATHHDKITCVSYIKRIRQYKRAHQKLKELHPERHQYNHDRFKGIKKYIYKFFAIRAWSHVIDGKVNLFLVFPQKIRYKIYDIIIQALGVEYPQVKL